MRRSKQKPHQFKNLQGTPNLSLFESQPAFEFREHAQDIVDLSWNDSSLNSKQQEQILSCSLDRTVLLWSLQSENSVPIAFFAHDEVPTSISFAPCNQDTFVSGCLDGAVRLWNIKKSQKMIFADRVQSNEKITTLCFSPDGTRLVVGLATIGVCQIYTHQSGTSLNFHSRIDCKNRRGRFSSGRKIAGVTFLNNFEFLVATNDSSLRLFRIEDCTQIVKFKGHFNENLQLMPSYDPGLNLITAGDETGRVIIWNLAKLRTSSPPMPTYTKAKERVFEAFSPFAELKGKKMFSPALANISMFASSRVVERANQLFKDQIGAFDDEDFDLEANLIMSRSAAAGDKPRESQASIVSQLKTIYKHR